MLRLINFSYNTEETKAVKLPKELESISFSYDGGRVSVNINGTEVFTSHLGGTDCSLELDAK